MSAGAASVAGGERHAGLDPVTRRAGRRSAHDICARKHCRPPGAPLSARVARVLLGLAFAILLSVGLRAVTVTGPERPELLAWTAWLVRLVALAFLSLVVVREAAQPLAVVPAGRRPGSTGHLAVADARGRLPVGGRDDERGGLVELGTFAASIAGACGSSAWDTSRELPPLVSTGWLVTACLFGLAVALVAHGLGRLGERLGHAETARFASLSTLFAVLSVVGLAAWSPALNWTSSGRSASPGTLVVASLGFGTMLVASAACAAHAPLLRAATRAVRL